MINKTIFTHDAAAVVFKDDADGITVDEDGDVEFDWDAVERVRVDDVPWADAFETTEFYKLPATVAKPIPQQYRFGEDMLTLKKPRQELKNGAWSLHNKPWTLGHPGTGMVKDVNDVHGFWRDPRYIDSIDNLDADLYLPVGDSDARAFLEKNSDVSVGFYNKTIAVDAYDGVVGGADDDTATIDGYQTNMLFDHVASVPTGRCSGEAGCGIQDGPDAGTVYADAMNEPEEAETTTEYDHSPFVDSGTLDSGAEIFMDKSGHFISGTHITHDYRDEDGNYFAVSPEENADGVPKYPIDSCTGEDSVESAWKLRGHGDIDISVDTLEERIQRRASALDCDVAPWENGEENDSTIDMTEETQDCGGLGLSDLSVDAVAAKHDGVQETIDAKDEKINELEEELAEAKDAEEAFDELEQERDTLQEKLDEYEADEKAELVEKILARTDAMGEEDELMDEEVDELEEKLELVKSLSADDVVANGDGASETPTITGPQRKTPWD